MKTIEEWKSSTLKNYLLKHKVHENETNHILDYLEKNPQRLQRLSYPQAKKKAEAWTKALNKKNKGLKEAGLVEEIITFSDGFKIVQLIDPISKKWEGLHMGHCVASYGNRTNIYSLRDQEDFPYVTLEIERKEVIQWVSKYNREVDEKYYPYLISFFEKNKISIKNCNTLRHSLGLWYLRPAEKCFVEAIAEGFGQKSVLGQVYTTIDKITLKKEPKILTNYRSMLGNCLISNEELEVGLRLLSASLNPDILNFLMLNLEYDKVRTLGYPDENKFEKVLFSKVWSDYLLNEDETALVKYVENFSVSQKDKVEIFEKGFFEGNNEIINLAKKNRIKIFCAISEKKDFTPKEKKYILNNFTEFNQICSGMGTARCSIVDEAIRQGRVEEILLLPEFSWKRDYSIGKRLATYFDSVEKIKKLDEDTQNEIGKNELVVYNLMSNINEESVEWLLKYYHLESLLYIALKKGSPDNIMEFFGRRKYKVSSRFLAQVVAVGICGVTFMENTLHEFISFFIDNDLVDEDSFKISQLKTMLSRINYKSA